MLFHTVSRSQCLLVTSREPRCWTGIVSSINHCTLCPELLLILISPGLGIWHWIRLVLLKLFNFCDDSLSRTWLTWVRINPAQQIYFYILDLQTDQSLSPFSSPHHCGSLGLSLNNRLITGMQFSVQFSSVAQSCPTLCNPCGQQHARPPWPSPTPGVYSNSCPLSQWCHPTISSSVVHFSSHLQSFPTLGSFQMSQLFMSGGQSIEVSASTSVLPMNTLWSPLGWTGWISLQSKGLSRVLSNTTVQKHQFFGVQLSL